MEKPWDLYGERPLCVVVDMDWVEYLHLCVAVFQRANKGCIIWVDSGWPVVGRNPMHAIISKPYWDASYRCWRAGGISFYRVLDHTFKGRTREDILAELCERPGLEVLSFCGTTEYEYLREKVYAEFGPLRSLDNPKHNREKNSFPMKGDSRNASPVL